MRCFGHSEYDWTNPLSPRGRLLSASDLDSLPKAASMAVGRGSACILTTEGTIRCFGNQFYNSICEDRYHVGGGKLLFYPSDDKGVAHIPPDHLGPFKGIFGHQSYFCTNFKTYAGTWRGYCWGGGVERSPGRPHWNRFPQHPNKKFTEDISGTDYDYLGDYANDPTDTGVLGLAGDPIDSLDDPMGEIVQMTGSRDRVCVLTVQGELYCWGGGVKENPVSVPLSKQVYFADKNGAICGISLSNNLWCKDFSIYP